MHLDQATTYGCRIHYSPLPVRVTYTPNCFRTNNLNFYPTTVAWPVFQLDSFGRRVLHAGDAQHAAQSPAREPGDPKIFYLQNYLDSQQFGPE
jgi:hypothetical protein